MGENGRSPTPVLAIGASAGGVSALTELVADLPADLPAAVTVVLHVTPTGPSLLPEILTRAGELPARHAVDGEPVEPGRIYVAPPDRHLLVAGDVVRVVRTPKENGVRPSVDTLFRSVARSRGARAVAVVLSGTLDDGTAGIVAVAEAGGRTVVQDPADAMFPGMPESARQFGHPEFVVKVSEMGELLAELVRGLPESANLEDVAVDALEADAERSNGTPSAFTCPDCGGTLFEREVDGILQFRCRVGHGYTADALVSEQQEKLESALYAAIVALEERADLSRRMARRMEQVGNTPFAHRYFTQADETERQASVVRETVSRLRETDEAQ
jgi:two-component system chemotaxis response regulator CheB